jgi:hypothetical protein
MIYKGKFDTRSEAEECLKNLPDPMNFFIKKQSYRAHGMIKTFWYVYPRYIKDE